MESKEDSTGNAKLAGGMEIVRRPGNRISRYSTVMAGVTCAMSLVILTAPLLGKALLGQELRSQDWKVAAKGAASFASFAPVPNAIPVAALRPAAAQVDR